MIVKPPYEVTETGWGEFEVVIKIYFNDPNERPVSLFLSPLFSSPELKSQVPGVHLSVICSHFHVLMNHWANFNHTFAQLSILR